MRALIVLWVLATTIGAFPPVTSAIHYVIREFVAHTAGLPTYQNISIIQGFFTYYGFVILVLFILFLLWDMINLASISRQIKKGAFSNKCLGPPAAFSATARAENYDKAIPEDLAKASPVYTLVAYIRPRARAFAPSDADSKQEQFDCWSSVRLGIESGALLKLYFKGSRKFIERLTGLIIGAVLLISPFLSGDGLIWQAIAIVVAFTTYLVILNVLIWRSTVDAGYLLLDFFRFYSRAWGAEPNPPAPAVPPQPQPAEENAR